MQKERDYVVNLEEYSQKLDSLKLRLTEIGDSL